MSRNTKSIKLGERIIHTNSKPYIIAEIGVNHEGSIKKAYKMIDLAKEIKSADQRGDKLGLSKDELAFYDAVSSNASAKDLLGDETLLKLARVLVERVKEKASIDWTVKESVRKKLKVIVKRTLRQYGYPPDLQKLATDTVLQQAEALAEFWN